MIKNHLFRKIDQNPLGFAKKKKETHKGSGTKFEQNRPYIRDFHHKKSISFLTTPSENELNSKEILH